MTEQASVEEPTPQAATAGGQILIELCGVCGIWMPQEVPGGQVEPAALCAHRARKVVPYILDTSDLAARVDDLSAVNERLTEQLIEAQHAVVSAEAIQDALEAIWDEHGAPVLWDELGKRVADRLFAAKPAGAEGEGHNPRQSP